MNDQERRIIERLGLGIELELEELEELENEAAFIAKLTLLSVIALHRKVDRIMTDIAALEEAVNALATAEGAAVAELTVLKEEVAQLTAGEITQEQIDAITGKVTDVATALTTAATDAAGGTKEPGPGDGGGVEEPPAGEGGGEPPAGGGEEPPAPE